MEAAHYTQGKTAARRVSCYSSAREPLWFFSPLARVSLRLSSLGLMAPNALQTQFRGLISLSWGGAVLGAARAKRHLGFLHPLTRASTWPERPLYAYLQSRPVGKYFVTDDRGMNTSRLQGAPWLGFPEVFRMEEEGDECYNCFHGSQRKRGTQKENRKHVCSEGVITVLITSWFFCELRKKSVYFHILKHFQIENKVDNIMHSYTIKYTRYGTEY